MSNKENKTKETERANVLTPSPSTQNRRQAFPILSKLHHYWESIIPQNLYDFLRNRFCDVHQKVDIECLSSLYVFNSIFFIVFIIVIPLIWTSLLLSLIRLLKTMVFSLSYNGYQNHYNSWISHYDVIITIYIITELYIFRNLFILNT